MSKHHSNKGKRKQPFKLKLPRETLYTLASTGLILFEFASSGHFRLAETLKLKTILINQNELKK